ncbi:hypothetical protein PR048_017968 [Dryococelus australis]|uniref:Uncharacterized protein n=1 Tax=Dryococelus australis TaxID=614101 RepID=A0ABQ9HAZ1_9NEOP|nr:hypothetical protein PR048_017968 [Dryococelus australis]
MICTEPNKNTDQIKKSTRTAEDTCKFNIFNALTYYPEKTRSQLTCCRAGEVIVGAIQAHKLAPILAAPADTPFCDWLLLVLGAAVAKRLDCSHPTKANRVQYTGLVTSRFSKVGIVPDDAAGRLVFSGISHFLHPCFPALLHSHLISPSSTLETSLLRAAQISQLNSTTLCTQFFLFRLEAGIFVLQNNRAQIHFRDWMTFTVMHCRCLPTNHGRSVLKLPNSDWPSEVSNCFPDKDTWPITKGKLHVCHRAESKATLRCSNFLPIVPRVLVIITSGTRISRKRFPPTLYSNTLRPYQQFSFDCWLRVSMRRHYEPPLGTQDRNQQVEKSPEKGMPTVTALKLNTSTKVEIPKETRKWAAITVCSVKSSCRKVQGILADNLLGAGPDSGTQAKRREIISWSHHTARPWHKPGRRTLHHGQLQERSVLLQQVNARWKGGVAVIRRNCDNIWRGEARRASKVFCNRAVSGFPPLLQQSYVMFFMEVWSSAARPTLPAFQWYNHTGRHVSPLVHTVFDTSWRTRVQSSPSSVTSDNQCAADICILVRTAVESSCRSKAVDNFKYVASTGDLNFRDKLSNWKTCRVAGVSLLVKREASVRCGYCSTNSGCFQDVTHTDNAISEYFDIAENGLFRSTVSQNIHFTRQTHARVLKDPAMNFATEIATIKNIGPPLKGVISIQSSVFLTNLRIENLITRDKKINSRGAAVAERLARSPPIKANRAQSPTGSPDFRKWESFKRGVSVELSSNHNSRRKEQVFGVYLASERISEILVALPLGRDTRISQKKIPYMLDFNTLRAYQMFPFAYWWHVFTQHEDNTCKPVQSLVLNGALDARGSAVFIAAKLSGLKLDPARRVSGAVARSHVAVVEQCCRRGTLLSRWAVQPRIAACNWQAGERGLAIYERPPCRGCNYLEERLASRLSRRLVVPWTTTHHVEGLSSVPVVLLRHRRRRRRPSRYVNFALPVGRKLAKFALFYGSTLKFIVLHMFESVPLVYWLLQQRGHIFPCDMVGRDRDCFSLADPYW